MTSSDGDRERDPGVAPNAVLTSASAGAATLQLTGTWRLAFIERITSQLAALELPAKLVVDGSKVGQIDSAGALALLNCLEAAGQSNARLTGFAANELRIVEQVRKRLDEAHAPTKHRRERLIEMIGR
ncbi:MAG TPA: STAS domain-containing protein, partial [Burkholderiaceae bacterium]|nr:STAS domain-containing protein [Burkholderiaceae bacterium]